MINVALCGYGTVGKGVKALLDSLDQKEVHLAKVLDIPAKKEELGSLLVTDYKDIINDPSINVVIECLGGDELPHKVIAESLAAGKNVISSNKETISLHLQEFLSLAKKSGASLQFEASCGGGIPLLNPIMNIARFDEIESIRGILNGTTNFILTKMQKDGKTFSDSLSEAQRLGFAEKDPTADLEGLDMVRKSNILAALAYGYEIHNEDIPHFGISHINEEILNSLAKTGKTVKFVSDLVKTKDGVSIIVIPELLDKDEPLANVTFETNGVEVMAKHNGPLSFIGKGAGREPTASAIIQDLERLLHLEAPHLTRKLVPVTVKTELKGRFYVFDEKNKMSELVDPSLEELKRYCFVSYLKEKRN